MDYGFKPDHVLNFVIDAHEIGMSDAEAETLPTILRTACISWPGWTM
jgi:hypothetical protein